MRAACSCAHLKKRAGTRAGAWGARKPSRGQGGFPCPENRPGQAWHAPGGGQEAPASAGAFPAAVVPAPSPHRDQGGPAGRRPRRRTGAGQKRAAAPADHRPESDRQRGSGKPCAFPLLLPVAGLRTGGALTRRRQQKLCSCVLPDGQDAILKGEIARNTRQIDFPLPNFAGA